MQKRTVSAGYSAWLGRWAADTVSFLRNHKDGHDRTDAVVVSPQLIGVSSIALQQTSPWLYIRRLWALCVSNWRSRLETYFPTIHVTLWMEADPGVGKAGVETRDKWGQTEFSALSR